MSITIDLQPQVQLYDLHPPLDDFRAEVLAGLSQSQKAISPKFLYDKRGAELFDAICTLEEYYLTRTEMAILRTNAAAIAQSIQDGVLIEFGSGSSQKVRILLDALAQNETQNVAQGLTEQFIHLPTYVGLDISKQHLQESCADLAAAYPGLEAIAVCTDYTQPLQLPDIPALHHRRRIGFFPGSSIGNLEPKEAVEFLQNTATFLGAGGRLLIGVDLKKSRDILEPAYADAQGISAAFALNLLARMNRELGTDFEVSQFGYRAFYNADAGRIEMYIVSLQAQTVHLDGVAIPLAEGELLRTEYSYKYSIAEFQRLAEAAGFQPQQVWTDPHELFSLHDLQVQ